MAQNTHGMFNTMESVSESEYPLEPWSVFLKTKACRVGWRQPTWMRCAPHVNTCGDFLRQRRDADSPACCHQDFRIGRGDKGSVFVTARKK